LRNIFCNKIIAKANQKLGKKLFCKVNFCKEKFGGKNLFCLIKGTRFFLLGYRNNFLRKVLRK
jgi:hypothetical protein